jgi:hypothetical protein
VTSRLTAKAVGDVLEATLRYRVEMDPRGFTLTRDDPAPRAARLRSGGGIAGNSDVWWLVRLPGGEVIVGQIRTRARLARAVLEFMAGPKPGELLGYTVPRAKRVIVPRTGASRFVWYRRLKKRPKPAVALVPFGAALR